MVDIAQLVERQIVALEVKGSRPFIHPSEHPRGCFFFAKVSRTKRKEKQRGVVVF